MASAEYLRYLNQGATRNLPLSPQLTSALGFLPELGVTAEVFSGGQPEKGSGGARVGSVRHDHGDAADVFFVKDGRRLDWANPEDRPLFEEIVQRGKASGLTGFGAGPGYMQAGSMHVGFGSPGVWGAGGKSAAAPDWLVAAYGGAPAPSQAPDTSGDTTLVGGAANDTLATGDYMPPNNPGGLGGLGGFINSGSGGDLLQAIGASLMGSPSNAPLAGFGDAMQANQQLRMRRELLEQEQAEKRDSRQALAAALQARGFTREEAAAYALNPAAATIAVDQKAEQTQVARANKTADWLESRHPDLAEAVRSQGMTGADALRLARDRDEEAKKPPELVTIYNEEGQEQKGYYAPGTRDFVPVGGAKTMARGTADDRKAMREAEDGVFAADQALTTLKTAAETSPGAYEGYTAGARAAIGNNLPDWAVPDFIASPEASVATRTLDQLTTEGALQQLKSIFGAAPTEGERQILLDIQGASSQPETVRRATYARAQQAIERRKMFNAERASELRGLTYGSNGGRRVIVPGSEGSDVIPPTAASGGSSPPAAPPPPAASAAPAAGNYRWNPTTNRMEPM